MADERLETDSGRQRRLEYQEELDKVTAARHIRTEHFSSHVKLEGYYESPNPSYMFQCDRLMKAESMFGRLQLGYHPARRRSFLFVHLKSSRYDTAAQPEPGLCGEEPGRVGGSDRESRREAVGGKGDPGPGQKDECRRAGKRDALSVP